MFCYICTHLAIEFLYGEVLLDGHCMQDSLKLDRVHQRLTYNDLKVRKGWDMCAE